ncbi:hypothetical protein BH11MYX1_BH11MYX1_19970 [soil metagenome]
MLRSVANQVKGILFLDYVRMVRANRAIEWHVWLDPGDLHYVLEDTIDPTGWYPMETFERVGNAILEHVGMSELARVELWGRRSATQLVAASPMLLAQGDPVESINRFRVLRQTFVDFDALDVPLLHPGAAQLVPRFRMGRVAEQAACFQMLGFFAGLIEHAGGADVDAKFRQRSWDGDPQTRLDLSWTSPEDR